MIKCVIKKMWYDTLDNLDVKCGVILLIGSLIVISYLTEIYPIVKIAFVISGVSILILIAIYLIINYMRDLIQYCRRFE